MKTEQTGTGERPQKQRGDSITPKRPAQEQTFEEWYSHQAPVSDRAVERFVRDYDRRHGVAKR